MFKFDFTTDLDDQELDPTLGFEATSHATSSTTNDTPTLQPSKGLSIDDLLDLLPSLISYSPLAVAPASGIPPIVLPRRDLFDARFQLIDEDVANPAIENGNTNGPGQGDSKRSALDFIESPSDLVRGVYEGGLKTWECSLDLVEYLADGLHEGRVSGFHGQSVLELGCGTALPSSFIFHQLCQNPPSANSDRPSYICMQDYNDSVLQLVTFPNILLAWYASPLSAPYRTSTNDPEMAPLLDPTTSGELPITPELKTAFLTSLNTHNIRLQFVAGSWETFHATIKPTRFGWVLSSETIYHSESLDPLMDVIQACCQDKDVVCLIAAKVLYFGVGGGVLELVRRCQTRRIEVEKVFERNIGVGRQILSLK